MPRSRRPTPGSHASVGRSARPSSSPATRRARLRDALIAPELAPGGDMETETRQRLEALLGRGLALGFDVRATRGTQRREEKLVSGWQLDVARVDPPAWGSIFVIEAVLEDPVQGERYRRAIAELIELWSRHGPDEDPGGDVE